MLSCQPKTSQEIKEEREWSDAEQRTVATRTFSEALQMEKGDVQTPPWDYEQLKKCVSLFTLLNVVLWGEKCDFAKKLEEIYQLLLPDLVSGMEYITPMFCKQVTWAIVHDKCNFFAKRLLPCQKSLKVDHSQDS